MSNVILSETTQISRKEYICSECKQPIEKATVYLRLVQKWEGRIVTDMSHEDCTKFAHKLCQIRPISPLETWEGRNWLWDAMAECRETKWQIINLARAVPAVRHRLLKTMWGMRIRANKSRAALQAARNPKELTHR